MPGGCGRCFLPLFQGITSGWGGKGSNRILNLEDMEGTKILKNQEETFNCYHSSISLGLKPQNSHVYGKILEGIRGWVLSPRFGKGSLDFSARLGGLLNQQDGIRNMTQIRCLSVLMWHPQEAEQLSWGQLVVLCISQQWWGTESPGPEVTWERGTQPPLTFSAGLCSLFSSLLSSFPREVE